MIRGVLSLGPFKGSLKLLSDPMTLALGLQIDPWIEINSYV
jgi:hypothetical protein